MWRFKFSFAKICEASVRRLLYVSTFLGKTNTTSLGDCSGIGACCIGAMTLGLLFPSVLDSRISCSLQSLSTVSPHSCGGTQVVRVFASPPMAATIQSSGVTDGLVRYLCLNHTAPDTRVACVSFMKTFWNQECLNDVPMTYPLLQCCA
jgi:hypothetical protein